MRLRNYALLLRSEIVKSRYCHGAAPVSKAAIPFLDSPLPKRLVRAGQVC